ncbi:MAG TPA: protein kinase, partial [Nannocystaceae bacterium]|nr:protein kinase [Nannocystaceae bacterium]
QQVAGALATLHAHGILHRDVHAANVVIERGADVRATLVDLGAIEVTARFYAVAELRYPTPPERRTAPRSGDLARLAWTAPEIRTGGRWTERSDVFSLGLLLFTLLTGKRPFVDGATRARSLRKHLPRCPGPLADAIAWALEVDPHRRCDATEFMGALADAAAEVEAVERGTPPANHARGRGSAAPMSARPPAAVADRDRLRRRATLPLAALGLVYLGFILGLVSDLRPDMNDRGSNTTTRTR